MPSPYYCGSFPFSAHGAKYTTARKPTVVQKTQKATKPSNTPRPHADAYVRRVVIEGVEPEIDGGRFSAKRVLGEPMNVFADVFTDGHDVIAGVVLYRHESESDWSQARLAPLVNDRYTGTFTPTQLGHYYFTLDAWVDRYATWCRDLTKKYDAGQNVGVELHAGAQLVKDAAKRAGGRDRKSLQEIARELEDETAAQDARVGIATAGTTTDLLAQYPDRRSSTRYLHELPVWVDPVKARYSTWYEMFPRSSWNGTGEHATFRDCENRLDYIASMGFDVLYLPPIHPIGTTFRKGPNNALKAEPEDPGSPWAIGVPDGGHKTIHPDLGDERSFRRFVRKAREKGIDIALDIALQCSPDHPYVEEHPTWFRWRPDGTIQYAENPPKKYQDIYPIEFESEDWEALWAELRDVFLHWVDLGVRIFRVDNPHTKPFSFWEWLIREVKSQHPDIIFLAEAFTRPKVMYRLAKLGYTQSYTYFAWRNTKHELTEYLTELTQGPARHFFRPNFWPNTPDILTEYLQTGGAPAFKARLVLAATLAASYGIYGPAFELLECEPREPGSEEYLNSEKYEVRTWHVDSSHSLREFIAKVNAIRRENPALHSNESLRFHDVQNDHLIAYTKSTDDQENIVFSVVNLDPYHVQSAWLRLPLDELGIAPDQPYQVHDLLGGGRYLWEGEWNYVELNPHIVPAHIFRVRRRVHTEHDFDYFQ